MLAWLFSLDSAPLLLAIGIYIFAWPCAFVELKDSSQTNAHLSVPWEIGSKSAQIQWNTGTQTIYTTLEHSFPTSSNALQTELESLSPKTNLN